ELLALLVDFDQQVLGLFLNVGRRFGAARLLPAFDLRVEGGVQTGERALRRRGLAGHAHQLFDGAVARGAIGCRKLDARVFLDHDLLGLLVLADGDLHRVLARLHARRGLTSESAATTAASTATAAPELAAGLFAAGFGELAGDCRFRR